MDTKGLQHGIPSISPSPRVFLRRGRRAFLQGLVLAAGACLVGRTATAQSVITHVVRSGETLSEIALRHGVTVRQIKEWNSLRGDTIYAEQELRLAPAKETFTRLAKVRDELDGPKVDSSRWKHIILHHSATSFGGASSFDRYHRQHRNMENGLAYHFVIGNGTNSRNGEIEIGGRWAKQLEGGHVASEWYNRNSIGICLVGNFEVTRPSAAQLESARQLISYLRMHILANDAKFLVHKEIEKTLCPGRYFPIQQFHEKFG